MTINLKMPDIQELKPRITVFGVGGAGGNAVNNMITAGLQGCDFVVANTDAQALAMNHAERLIQMGVAVTEGLGAGSQPEVGSAAAEEVIDEINDHLSGSHMVFITAGMGGGTGTGAAPVIARAARAQGILTVGVVTKPFQFEGARRMRIAEAGIQELQRNVDTLIVIPNQNLFRIANAQTTFADAFAMADQVLYSGVACITDLMVKEGLINLDFADVRSIMRGMGKAMMGTGEASGENRAQQAAEAAIANPLLDETSMKGAKGLLISITGGNDLTLFEVDEAATRIREEVDADANIILGATFDESMDGIIRVSVVATGIDKELMMGNAELGAIPAPKAEPVSRPAINTAPRQPERPIEQRPAVTSFQQDAASRALASLERELAINEPAPAAQVSEAVEAKSFRPAAEAVNTAPVVAEMPAAPVQQPLQAAVPFETPVAEQPMAAPRMPRVEDFPPIAQRELMARQPQRPEAVAPAPAAPAPAPQQMAAPAFDAEEHGDDRRPMGLLRRLASGLSRRDEHDEEAAHEAAPVMTQRAPAAAPQPQMRPAPRMPQMAPAQQGRPAGAAGQLDMTGRAPVRPQVHSEEDQLEIPAFLRRQSN